MQFQQYDLGHLNGGEVVEVTLKNAANVRLLDSSNFSNYKAGRKHSFYGGYVTRSPYRVSVPRSGRWYVAIDLGGYSGRVSSAVKVLPGRLPQAKQPLSSVPTLVRDREEVSYYGDDPIIRNYDVFISHASEDKDEIVRPLAYSLQNKGLKVWYDEFELGIGDSLRRKIDKGLAGSRFGIVVLSRSFIKKGWANYELDGIVTKSMTGDQVVLPIWHNITKQEVVDYSPSLADKLARNTTDFTVDEIATEIAELIKSR